MGDGGVGVGGHCRSGAPLGLHRAGSSVVVVVVDLGLGRRRVGRVLDYGAVSLQLPLTDSAVRPRRHLSAAKSRRSWWWWWSFEVGATLTKRVGPWAPLE